MSHHREELPETVQESVDGHVGQQGRNQAHGRVGKTALSSNLLMSPKVGPTLPQQAPNGPSWGPLGALLGASWGHLGAPWGVLGGIRGGLGGFLGGLEHEVALECDLEALWSRGGVLLGPSWGHLGVPLGPLGAVLGSLRAVSEPSWGQLGHLKKESGEVAKTCKNPRFLQGLGTPRGSKTRPSWAKLGSSCDLEPS